jgi:YcxB-like protein
MRIEYTNTFRDIFLFHAVHQFLSSVLQVFLLFFCVYMSFSEFTRGNFLAASFTALFWYIFLWVIQIAFNAVYAYSKKSKSVLTNHIVEVTDQHIYEETVFNKSFFYWPGVFKAISCPGFVAVYVTPSMAHIIPNRAFKSKEERVAFLKLVKSKINAVKKAA